MAQKYGGTFSRRGPDMVMEELATALSSKAAFEFKPLFDIVHASLRARHAASGGEEMLRLRVYEKLQGLVNRGLVKKSIIKGVKEYQGLAALASVLPTAPIEALPTTLPTIPMAALPVIPISTGAVA
jgi:hypothetical protein